MIDSELVEWGNLTAATLRGELARDDVSIQEPRDFFFDGHVRDMERGRRFLVFEMRSPG